MAAILAAGLSCRSNHPPAVPAAPTGPACCFADTTYTFRTIATDPDGGNVAVRFDWGDSTVSDWTGLVPSGDPSTLTHAWRDTGAYEVIVQARDQAEQRSGWSSAIAVRVVLRRPPNMPHGLTGPDRGGQDTSYTFATLASHPDGIPVAIRFAWGDGDTADWSAFVASGEPVAMSHAWTAPDTCVVTAQARDTGTGLSQWSLPHSIVIKPPDTLRLWRLYLGDSGGSMTSSPAIGPDGTIYVGSSDSSLYAVNPDGTTKWRYLTGGSVASALAFAPDGRLYFGSDDNCVYCLTPSCKLLWRYTTGGDATSPAIAADGTVYVGSWDRYLYALNPVGTLKWRYYIGRTSASSAIAADGTVHVGSNSDTLYALNPDGTPKWKYDVGEDIRSSPAIGPDGTIYFGTEQYGGFNALNPDGTLKWRCLYKMVRTSSSVASDGTVYIGTGDSLHALNSNGTHRWMYAAGSSSCVSPAIAVDGTVYFGSSDNFLYALNSDGTLKWRYETGSRIEASPTIAPDGTVYCTSSDGYLYALKGTSPLADSPWPKFHHDLRNTGRVGGGK